MTFTVRLQVCKLALDADIHSKIADVYVPGLQEVIAGTVTPEDLMFEVQEIAEEVQGDSEE